MDGTTGCHKALCNFKSPEACTDGVHISFSSVIEHCSIRKKKILFKLARSVLIIFVTMCVLSLGNLKSTHVVGSGTGKGTVER